MARNLLYKNQGMLSPYKKQMKSQSLKRGIAENPKSLSTRYIQNDDQIQQNIDFDSLLSDIGTQTQNLNQQSNLNTQQYIQIPTSYNQAQSHQDENLCQCQQCFKNQYPAGSQTDKQYNNVYQSYTTFHNSPSKKEPCARQMKYQKLKRAQIISSSQKAYNKGHQDKQSIRQIPKRGAYKFTATYKKPPQKIQCNCLDLDTEEIEQIYDNKQQNKKQYQVPPASTAIQYNQYTNPSQTLDLASSKLQPFEQIQKFQENDKFYKIRCQNLNQKLQEAKYILRQVRNSPRKFQLQNQQQQPFIATPEQQYYTQLYPYSNRNSVESEKTLKYQNSQGNSPFVQTNRELFQHEKNRSPTNYAYQEQNIKGLFNEGIDEHTLEKIQQAAKHISSIGGEITQQAIQLREGLAQTKTELEYRLNNVNKVLHYFDHDLSGNRQNIASYEGKV